MDYQNNVQQLVQEALDHLSLAQTERQNVEAQLGSPIGTELDLLLTNLEKRLRRISHLQPNESISDVKSRLPVYHGVLEGE